MSVEENNYLELKRITINNGGSIFGVADIEPLKHEFLLLRAELDGLMYGISVGVSLSPAVLDGIYSSPTILYKWHYRQANNLLDRIAFIITQKIISKGYRAIPIPASQIVDWEKQKGHVSHRTIGEAAGLGWRGRNNLLVNHRFGSQFRLVTVLTDLPLKTDRAVDSECGECNKCVLICPAGALGGSSRDYNFDKCYGLLKEFSKERGIGVYICGICVKACKGKSGK